MKRKGEAKYSILVPKCNSSVIIGATLLLSGCDSYNQTMQDAVLEVFRPDLVPCAIYNKCPTPPTNTWIGSSPPAGPPAWTAGAAWTNDPATNANCEMLAGSAWVNFRTERMWEAQGDPPAIAASKTVYNVDDVVLQRMAAAAPSSMTAEEFRRMILDRCLANAAAPRSE